MSRPQASSTRAAVDVEQLGLCVRHEVLPLLNALSQLTDMHRILTEVCATADVDPAFARGLDVACPSYRNPYAAGGDDAAEATISELARCARDAVEKVEQDLQGLSKALAGGEPVS